QQFNAQVGVAFVSDYWESTAIDGGNSGSESKFIAGELRLDLFALPGVDPPPPRANPLIVGGGANITHDTNINWGSGTMTTSPAVPAGVMAGDFLLAIVANNFGESTEINPVETGWTLAHSRNDGVSGDVHMKMYLREATSSEPAHYNFTNGFLAESITMMVALRNVPAFEGDEGSAWYIASNLSTWQWVETQIAPSIQRAGQLLLAVSYFTIASWQAPIHQTVPPGMTSLIDQSETVSTMAIASLANPPNPTADRQFTPSAVPQFSGHSITASILVPGNQII
ncbi:MAG: hypothetical protein JOY78_13780, partial [Pseudonocardia sp.]|nr:hypothetical protein [Pseudonocardia sp.]